MEIDQEVDGRKYAKNDPPVAIQAGRFSLIRFSIPG